MSKYKVGDKVRVTFNKDGHRFKIGEIVTIFLKLKGGWDCLSSDGIEEWSLSEEEFELANVDPAVEQGDYLEYKHYQGMILREELKKKKSS